MGQGLRRTRVTRAMVRATRSPLNGDDAAEQAAPPRFRKVDRKLNKPPSSNTGGRHPWWDDVEEDEDEEPESWPNAESPAPGRGELPELGFSTPRGVQVEIAPWPSAAHDDAGPTYSTQFLPARADRHLELRPSASASRPSSAARSTPPGSRRSRSTSRCTLWDESENHLIPAVGSEAYILDEIDANPSVARAQPSISRLFDHTLPKEHPTSSGTSGSNGGPGPGGATTTTSTARSTPSTIRSRPRPWNSTSNGQRQRRFFDRLDLFTHGYLNSSAIPNLGDGVVVGGRRGLDGHAWRTSFFGSYNAGLNKDAPTTSAILGGS